MVSDCNTMDIKLEGYPFTWARSKGTTYEVEERIDRAIVNPLIVASYSRSEVEEPYPLNLGS